MKFVVAFICSLLTCGLASIVQEAAVTVLDASMVSILWMLYHRANEND